MLLARRLTSRRSKFLVVVLWLLALAAIAPIAGGLADSEENEVRSYLPAGGESTRVFDQQRDFEADPIKPAVVVARRASGLTPADRQLVDRGRDDLADAGIAGALAPTPVQESPDRSALSYTVPIDDRGDEDVTAEAAEKIREALGGGAGGLEVAVTGPAGIAADAADVFGSIDGKLIVAALAVVIVMLLLTYRSPTLWILPLVAVFISLLSAQAAARGLGELGVTLTGQSSAILGSLIFGVATDYSLLLVARYREQLHVHEDRHVAMARALRAAFVPIVASAGTVVAALLVFGLADVGSTVGTGLVCAVGVAVSAVVILTLLPALLLLGGRRAFWPNVPRVGAAPPVVASRWGRLGTAVVARPARYAVVSLVALTVMSLGLVVYDERRTSDEQFRGTVESQSGQQLLTAAGFAPGASAPTEIVVTPATDVERARAAAQGPGVAAVGEAESAAGRARFTVTLDAEPLSQEGLDRIPPLRERLREQVSGAALVGGPTAQEVDLREASTDDALLTTPLILLAAAIVLGLVLRAAVLSLVLLGVAVASFGAALGLGALVTDVLLGYDAGAPNVALFSFLFLVALGVDYNIFLMTRVREEVARHGHQLGLVRGLASTGSVITSAGLVLAGTFAALASVPLVFLTQLGITVALGVLLDTFLVRSLLVPSLVAAIGPRVWLPRPPSPSPGDPDGAARPPVTTTAA